MQKGTTTSDYSSSPEQRAGASATPLPSASSATSRASASDPSVFNRELWLSASHILREFAPLQKLATRKEEEEANDDQSGDEDDDEDVRPAGAEERRKLLLVMVGLPARGKSFLAHRLTNYLTWYGLRTRVFNVGAYRRSVGGNEDAEFFDAGNKDAAATREHLAWTVFSELLQWLTSGRGDVGIFDATNTTGLATPVIGFAVACPDAARDAQASEIAIAGRGRREQNCCVLRPTHVSCSSETLTYCAASFCRIHCFRYLAMLIWPCCQTRGAGKSWTRQWRKFQISKCKKSPFSPHNDALALPGARGLRVSTERGRMCFQAFHREYLR
jgi:hypothetical protein